MRDVTRAWMRVAVLLGVSDGRRRLILWRWKMADLVTQTLNLDGRWGACGVVNA